MLPVDVVFRNMQRSDAIQGRIRAKAEELVLFDPGLHACRAVVDLPHRHQKHGDRFRVRLELSVPGAKPLLVEHGPVADLHQAVHDVFETARRRLTSHVQRCRGAIKTHATKNRGQEFDAADLWH